MNKNSLLVPRKIPVQNSPHRLRMRETFGTSYHPCSVNTTRGFYLNVFPNFTLMNVEKPPCFLRKFSPDGRHFIAFSTSQTRLEIFRYNGSQAAGSLVDLCTSCDPEYFERCTKDDFLEDDNVLKHVNLRNRIFGQFFKFLGSVPLVDNNGQQLNRECSLFTECGRFVIVGSANYLPDDPHPPMHVIYTNNESVSPNPRNPLEDYSIFVVDVANLKRVDTLTFNNDKIFLSHNQGLYLHRDRLAILSVQHQTVHVFGLDAESGLLTRIFKIGRTLYDTDEYLLCCTGQAEGQQASALPRSRAFGSRAYRNYHEGVLNQLKHRVLVFLYRRASSLSRMDGNLYELRRFYQRFDLIRCLRMWKMQLLDQHHLLIKYASEEVVTLRSSEPNSQFSIFVVYNMESTKVVNVFENTSEELLDHFERFSDHFRNTNYKQRTLCNGVYAYRDFDGGQHHVTSSSSNNAHANLIQQRFKQTVLSAKNGGSMEARKRILAQLPISAQSYTGSPFLDLGLLSYNEKWVSVLERPKVCGEQAIHFYGRECGQIKFRMYAGMQQGRGMSPPPSPPAAVRRLVAFIFHPTEPFAISVQRTNLEYVVNFHIRKSASCLCSHNIVAAADRSGGRRV